MFDMSQGLTLCGRGTSSSGRASDSHSEGIGIDARVLQLKSLHMKTKDKRMINNRVKVSDVNPMVTIVPSERLDVSWFSLVSYSICLIQTIMTGTDEG